MNCPTNPTVSILKEKETDSTNNRLAQLCDRENIKEFTTLLVLITSTKNIGIKYH